MKDRFLNCIRLQGNRNGSIGSIPCDATYLYT
jgi:hypothetical protein